ncbi:MAG TPA: cytochrome P450 [Acidimicrobiales bacterium]|jgi:cytochrome P450|nr:cytochrome P450 [Acidimicrobiales bacterium]
MQLTDIDIYDPDAFVDGVPHEQFALLRREAPVYWHPHPDGTGYWAVTRHADIVKVNRDAATFSSWQGTALLMDWDDPEAIEQQRMMMLNLDPPDHTRLRKIVNKGFTPKHIRELSAMLERRAHGIVAEVAERGACDFVVDVAAELPLQAIAELMGVPQEDRKVIFELSNKLVGAGDPEYEVPPDEMGIAAAEMFGYAQEMATFKRANPGDDIVTTLLNAEVDGERLTDLEFNLFFMLLAVAGNETTRNAISHSMLALLQHPDERQQLIDEPDVLGLAIEEFLRWASPVMQFRRTATRDTELGGQKIAEGDRVVIYHISGNRDEAVFDDPYTFDIDRDPNLHLQQIAFGGGGPHFCLGANLARAEMRIMFDELRPLLPSMELAGDVQRLRSNFINGIKHLPVSWEPRAVPA